MRLKHAHYKAGAWANEVLQVVRGPVINALYKRPPTHYLGYVIDGKVPVILIPGVLNRWGYMKGLGTAISLLGHPVHIVPELGSNIESIPKSARIVHSLVRSLFSPPPHTLPQVRAGAESIRDYIHDKDLKGVVLVAHSKGGLIGKYVLAHYNEGGRVLGLVAIATPFSGSAMATLFRHAALRELEAGSEIIQYLDNHRDVNKKIISIYPEYDTHVWAKRGSFLEGAKNIELPVHGHSVIDTKEVRAAVITAVEKLTRTAI